MKQENWKTPNDIAILLVNRGCILHLITLLLKYRATYFDIRQILLSLRVNTRKTWRYKNFMPRFAREIISSQRPLIIQNRKNQGAINSNRANRLILAPKLEKHPPFILKRDQLQAFWPMARNFQFFSIFPLLYAQKLRLERSWNAMEIFTLALQARRLCVCLFRAYEAWLNSISRLNIGPRY